MLIVDEVTDMRNDDCAMPTTSTVGTTSGMHDAAARPSASTLRGTARAKLHVIEKVMALVRRRGRRSAKVGGLGRRRIHRESRGRSGRTRHALERLPWRAFGQRSRAQ